MWRFPFGVRRQRCPAWIGRDTLVDLGFVGLRRVCWSHACDARDFSGLCSVVECFAGRRRRLVDELWGR